MCKMNNKKMKTTFPLFPSRPQEIRIHETYGCEEYLAKKSKFRIRITVIKYQNMSIQIDSKMLYVNHINALSRGFTPLSRGFMPLSREHTTISRGFTTLSRQLLLMLLHAVFIRTHFIRDLNVECQNIKELIILQEKPLRNFSI